VIDTGVPHVLVHTAHGPHGAILFAHNLSPDPATSASRPCPANGTGR
jgi:hypothetical protein